MLAASSADDANEREALSGYKGALEGGKIVKMLVFKMRFSFKMAIPLAPGFSPVMDDGCGLNSRFNGFFAGSKAAEAADTTSTRNVTGLKPSVNVK